MDSKKPSFRSFLLELINSFQPISSNPFIEKSLLFSDWLNSHKNGIIQLFPNYSYQSFIADICFDIKFNIKNERFNEASSFFTYFNLIFENEGVQIVNIENESLPENLSQPKNEESEPKNTSEAISGEINEWFTSLTSRLDAKMKNLDKLKSCNNINNQLRDSRDKKIICGSLMKSKLTKYVEFLNNEIEFRHAKDDILTFIIQVQDFLSPYLHFIRNLLKELSYFQFEPSLSQNIKNDLTIYLKLLVNLLKEGQLMSYRELINKGKLICLVELFNVDELIFKNGLKNIVLDGLVELRKETFEDVEFIVDFFEEKNFFNDLWKSCFRISIFLFLSRRN